MYMQCHRCVSIAAHSPWKKCECGSHQKDKPELGSGRSHLHSKECVHQPLLGVNGAVNVVEDECDGDTAP